MTCAAIVFVYLAVGAAVAGMLWRLGLLEWEDDARRAVDDALRVARRVLRFGGTYYVPRFWLDGEEVSRGA